jgi:tetratricopeptide (TPR) repeat protein
VVLNRNDNALADLNAILKTNPRMGYAYALRGAVFMKQQKSAQALADYNAALSCGYQDPTMLKNMSEQYAKDEKFETAVTCLTKLIDMTPNGPAKADLYKKRLELYKKEAPTDSNFDSNSKLVAADLLSIAHLEPNNAQVRCQFADSQWQRQPGLALQALDEAIKLDPNNAKSYALRAKIRLDHGRDKDALADASKAIELDPKDASSYLTRAQSQLDLRSYGEAVNDAASALSMAPDLAEAYFFKGEALQASSQNKDALGAFNQYLQLKSKDASPSSDDLRHIEEAKRRVKFVEGRLEAAARMTEINTTK